MPQRIIRRRNGLDHGVLNVPLDKRGGGSLDAQIDRWKRERAAAAKVERKTAAAKHKADKAEALALLAIVGDAVAEQFAARHPEHTKKATKTFLTQMAKDQPEKAIAFLTRLLKDYGLDEPRSNPRRRTAPRRRNPEVPEAVLAAEALPLLSQRELAALSDEDLFDYRSTLFRLAFGAERYARKGSAEGDRAYAAQMRLADYGYGFMQDMALERLAARKAAEKAARKAGAAAKRAATMAKKKAEAGFVSPTYFPASAKVRLGERVYVDEGDAFKVTGLAAASDPHNAQYATELVASGVRDERNHQGDWAVIERGSDAFIVSVGKGLKRNPRRRAARRTARRR